MKEEVIDLGEDEQFSRTGHDGMIRPSQSISHDSQSGHREIDQSGYSSAMSGRVANLGSHQVSISGHSPPRRYDMTNGNLDGRDDAEHDDVDDDDDGGSIRLAYDDEPEEPSRPVPFPPTVQPGSGVFLGAPLPVPSTVPASHGHPGSDFSPTALNVRQADLQDAASAQTIPIAQASRDETLPHAMYPSLSHPVSPVDHADEEQLRHARDAAEARKAESERKEAERLAIEREYRRREEESFRRQAEERERAMLAQQQELAERRRIQAEEDERRQMVELERVKAEEEEAERRRLAELERVRRAEQLAEQKRWEEQEAMRVEQERREAARMEKERAEEEERWRIEQERLEVERRRLETLRIEEERRVDEQRRRKAALSEGLRQGKASGGVMLRGVSLSRSHLLVLSITTLSVLNMLTRQWVTVQTTKSVIWRRRWFSLLGSEMRLYKSEGVSRTVCTEEERGAHGNRIRSPCRRSI